MSEAKISILDGYLDEPSCLGVPPYISPHVRYTYGALKDVGLANEDINYITIDQLRDNQEDLMSKLQSSEIVILIAGTTVPGRYLGGQPISLQEIESIGQKLEEPEVLLSGPITNCGLEINYIDDVAEEIPGLAIYQKLTDIDLQDKLEVAKIVDKWACLGVEVSTRHPNFPYLVCEIETFRGCPRDNHCSFCSEGFKEITYHRSIEGIINEVKGLAKLGNNYFRLGCQTDLLLYQAEQKKGRLTPNPAAIDELYSGIRKVTPELKVLHMDNVNPSTIADFPDEAAQILKTIAKYNTAGDVAAFGLESADPEVLTANNIGTDVEKTLKAIKMMNEYSGYREDGVPKLLPGINLLHGLQGESKKTMDLNFHFLKEVLDSALMVRRINIRQVNPLKDYEAEHGYNKHQFKKYKSKINEEINKAMLKRVFPMGTKLKEVIIEEVKGKLSFGRQLGTYPILVGIPGQYELGKVLDLKVIDHGYRSLTALPIPFNINEAGIAELEALPGIGKKRAMRIFMKKDIKDLDHLDQILDYSYDVEQLSGLVEFK
jgi:radical SAM superfamily enzyme with C-terminal helix-hairpin-helix motif